jgi:alpha-ketoglutarate-dependent taurine dioxygenase
VASNATDRLRVIPTGRALGAEIRGVNLAEEVAPETRDALVRAWIDHLVLLFRDQDLTEDQFVAAARIFGELQASTTRERPGAAAEPEAVKASQPEVCVLHNIGPDGRPTATNSGAGSSELPWHSDNSYAEAPPAGSALYACEVPPSGGNTYFSNQYLAFESLDVEVRHAIEGRTAVQDFSRDGTGELRPGVEPPNRPDEVPGSHHPIARTHPQSGRKSLYLGRRYAYPSQYIDGLPYEESERLLDFLWNRATDPAFVWCHAWRRGDLLLWDNRCTLHRRDPIPPNAPRIMRRTMIRETLAVPQKTPP